MKTASVLTQIDGATWGDRAAPVKYDPLPWQVRGLQQTASGYGRKLTTGYKVWFCGRWRRVYHCQYSNIGTSYIDSLGRRYIVEFNS